MKRYLLLIACLFSFNVWAQNISIEKAQQVAQTFLNKENTPCLIQSVVPKVSNNGDTLFYIVNATPSSYVIVSANSNVWPIVAWSTTSNFDELLPFAQILESDVVSRIQKAPLLSEAQKQSISNQWFLLSGNEYQNMRAQTWPEPGTTSTGGWIETKWTQTAPYNSMCPIDPVTNTRSYAGCPAIVMGQIINYLRTTNNKRFDDSDDYQHNYAGRVYQIDDDAELVDFPTFPKLNIWLDSAEVIFKQGKSATGSVAAALVFASGTACTQVYTSQASGTFSVDQAFNAYQRFNFNDSKLYETTDSVMYTTLIDNLKNGWPAHLAVVDQSWSTGHNVAVDGYRDDGYFHINFGWGGSCDGWWQIPDPSFPYSMSVLEGIVVDIIPKGGTGINQTSIRNVEIYPNPATDIVFIKSNVNTSYCYSVYSLSGQLVQSGTSNGSFSVENLRKGLYLVYLKSDFETIVSKLVVE